MKETRPYQVPYMWPENKSDDGNEKPNVEKYTLKKMLSEVWNFLCAFGVPIIIVLVISFGIICAYFGIQADNRKQALLRDLQSHALETCTKMNAIDRGSCVECMMTTSTNDDPRCAKASRWHLSE